MKLYPTICATCFPSMEAWATFTSLWITTPKGREVSLTFSLRILAMLKTPSKVWMGSVSSAILWRFSSPKEIVKALARWGERTRSPKENAIVEGDTPGAAAVVAAGTDVVGIRDATEIGTGTAMEGGEGGMRGGEDLDRAQSQRANLRKIGHLENLHPGLHPLQQTRRFLTAVVTSTTNLTSTLPTELTATKEITAHYQPYFLWRCLRAKSRTPIPLFPSKRSRLASRSLWLVMYTIHCIVGFQCFETMIGVWYRVQIWKYVMVPTSNNRFHGIRLSSRLFF